MSAQHRHTCDELGICQARQPRCANCALDNRDLPPMATAYICFAALLVLHFGGWLP